MGFWEIDTNTFSLWNGSSWGDSNPDQSFNVVSFGARGDGNPSDAAANRAAIQAAIDAIPSTGGLLYFPSGYYYINDEIVLKNYVRVQGTQAAAVTIDQTDTTKRVFVATDALRITIENLRIKSQTTGSGTGIHFVRSTRTSNYIALRNLEITNFGGDGVKFDDTVVTVIENVLVNTVKGHGFNVASTVTVSTSISFIGTYALQCDQAGYNLKSITYGALMGTAADFCGIGYLIDGSSGLSLNACGAESCRNLNATYDGTAFKVTGGSSSITINGGYSYDNTNVAFYVTGNSSRVAWLNCREVTPNGTAVNSFKVDSGSSRVSILGKNYLTAVSLATATTNFPLTNTAVVKPSDQFVTNNVTLVNDTALVAFCDANSTYELDVVLKYSGSTTANIKVGFTAPSGAALEWTIDGVDITAGATSGIINRASAAIGGTLTASGAGNGVNMFLKIKGTLTIGATSGNIQLQWAQNVLDAGVSTVVRAKSYLKIQQIG
jgi:hypothetical protein